MSFDTHLFDCAICGRAVRDCDGRNGRDRHLSPVCRGCEKYYGGRDPQAGAFMDRRIAVQISALAEALQGFASVKEWENRYGRA